MGFTDINEAQKIRISFSEKAMSIIEEDMNVFGVPSRTAFINTVITNFHEDAVSSIFTCIEKYRSNLTKLLKDSEPDSSKIDKVIDKLVDQKKKSLRKQIDQFKANKDHSKLYYINDENVAFLFSDECMESDKNNPDEGESSPYGDRPGLYIKCLLEEYCSLPFIKREQIFRKDIYDQINIACENKYILYVTVPFNEKKQTFCVYPYKIVADPMSTQDYLVCYSRKKEDKENDKIIASFSMSRIHISRLSRSRVFHLTQKERKEIDDKLARYSPAYLIGENEEIHVKLTENGKQTFLKKLHSRPVKNEKKSTTDEYVFDCSEFQAYNYFFSFGADAEILSPLSLRQKFADSYSAASKLYQ